MSCVGVLSAMRKLGIRPEMLLRVRIGPALHHPTFPHAKITGFLRRPARSESRARGPVARSAEKNRKACAFIEDPLPRGWPHTLVGEGKEGGAFGNGKSAWRRPVWAPLR
jgi:hypothetical protein